MMYIQQKYTASLDWVMLEIKLPREIFKSPLATEIAISGFLQSAGASTKYARNFEGKVPHFGSLEIASIEGVIHFYIRVQRRFRNLMEANFYAQYPTIEIIEADDFTKLIYFDHLSKDMMLIGTNYRPVKKWTPTDPETGEPMKDLKGEDVKMKADYLPIKTYVDYGLDKDPKEEFKVDPLTPLLETMGSLGKGEYMWYQVLVQDESVYDGKKKMPKLYVNPKTHDHMNLKEMADARKAQIRTASWNVVGKVSVSEFGVPTVIDAYKETNGEYEQLFDEEIDKDGKVTKKPKKILARHLKTKAVPKDEIKLTVEEKEEIEAINKKFTKPLAMAAIRLLYVCKAENWNGGQASSVLSFGKGFTGINSLTFSKITDPYDYPWEREGGKRVYWRSEELFEAFVEREAFYPHIKDRAGMELWEDRFFYTSSMRNRKLFRMIYEAILHPFEHPTAEDVVTTLNLEEIATLWHLPGATAGTPTLPRIDSTKGIAPVNLPL